MLKRGLCLTILASVLVACSAKPTGYAPGASAAGKPIPTAPEYENSAVPASESMQPPPPKMAVGPGAVRRYLAVHRIIEVETTSDKVEPLWQQIQEKCIALGGEVISSGIRKDGDGPRSADLSLQIPPERVPTLLALLSQGGDVLDSRTESEDKTAAVIDVEAHLKNLTDERDRLRQLLDTRTGKLSDVLEVQNALTEAQTELDSYTGQRKALAQQTDKVRIDISLHSPYAQNARGAWAPLRQSWYDAAGVFAGSLGAMITFVTASVPWLVIIVPLFVAIRRLWRRRYTAKM